MNYDTIFYWIGVASASFFVLLGMSVFAGFVMDLVWKKFTSAMDLAEVIRVWNEHKPQKQKIET